MARMGLESCGQLYGVKLHRTSSMRVVSASTHVLLRETGPRLSPQCVYLNGGKRRWRPRLSVLGYKRTVVRVY